MIAIRTLECSSMEALEIRTTFLYHSFEHRQLQSSEKASNLRRSEVVGQFIECVTCMKIIESVRLSQCLLFFGYEAAIPSVRPYHPEHISKLVVIGADHAAFDGTEMMTDEERECRSESVVAEELSSVACSEGLAVVFEENHPLLCAEVCNSVDVAAESENVREEDGVQAVDLLLQLLRRHIEVIYAAVDGDGDEPELHDRHDVRRPRDGRHSYFVTFLQSPKIQERLNEAEIRSTSATHENRTRSFLVRMKRFLERGALFSHTESRGSLHEFGQTTSRLRFREERRAHEGNLDRRHCGNRTMFRVCFDASQSGPTLRRMNIAYCTNVRLPSERAHGHHIAKVTEALRNMGHEIEIFAPYRKNSIEQSFETYYGITSPIRLHHLGSTDGIAAWWAPGIIGLKLTTYLLGRNLRKILRSRSYDFDLLYTRTPELLPFITGLGIPVILELHRIPRIGTRRFLRLIRSCKLVVALTSPMRQALIDMGVSDVPVIVEGDGVDLHDFEDLPSAKDTRASLGVPDDIPLIVYAGQLTSMGLSKGIPELIAALELLHDRGLEFRAVIAGGPESEKEKFMTSISGGLKPRVNFTGHIAHLKIPTLLTAADILVYPAPKSNHPFYARDTSPLKLFEYMAAGKPIVAADLPPLRDVVDLSTVTFCEPGNPESLAEGMLTILERGDDAQKRAKLARAHVEQFTWEKRMERILKAARLRES